MNYDKTQVLKMVLGEPKRSEPSEKGELEFACPFCGSGLRKKKLAVNVNKDVAHCWICEWHGSVHFLFRKLNVEPTLTKRYYKYKLRDVSNLKAEEPKVEVELPEGYSLLAHSKDISLSKGMALEHLFSSRNLTPRDIQKYNIGYTSEGRFAFRIVVPSYDEHGNLNFFSARAFPIEHKLKYLFPHISKNDIIFNELFIDWKGTVILVEGVFDALVTPNSVPLLGKELHDLLLSKLIKSKSDVKLLLDGDAEGVKAAKQVARKLIKHGVSVEVVFCPPNQDPSDLGKEKVKELLLQSKSVSLMDIDLIWRLHGM
jgi:DNA primase